VQNANREENCWKGFQCIGKYPWSESSAWSLPLRKLRFRSNFFAVDCTSNESSPFPYTSSLKPSSSFLFFANRSINSLYPFAHTIFPRKYAPLENDCCPRSFSAAIFSPTLRNLGFTPWTLQMVDLGRSCVAAERRKICRNHNWLVKELRLMELTKLWLRKDD